MDLDEIHARQDQFYGSMIGAFEEQLRSVVSRAQARMAAYLQANLRITDGRIDQTPGNLRTIRTLDDRFMEFLDDAGYSSLLNGYVSSFAGEKVFLQETLQSLGFDFRERGSLSRVAASGTKSVSGSAAASDAEPAPAPGTSASAESVVSKESAGKPKAAQPESPKTPELPTAVEFTPDDLKLLSSLQVNAVSSMTAATEAAAGSAMQQALFSVGGLKFENLLEALASKIDASIPRIRTIAETSMTTYYRTLTDRAFQKIEADVPEIEQRYRYSGPLDSRNRPFCRRLEVSDKAYSRAEIERMNNGQIPNVFLSAGGWNCRHVWILDTRKQPAAAA